MTQYTTDFGSLHDYKKGKVGIIDDDPKRYVFSNLFEAAAKAQPWERVAVAKNFEYVIESVRAKGISPWYTAAHDEFVLSMDGKCRVDFVKLDDPDAVVDPESEGAHQLSGDPEGKNMGYVVLGRGHMAMLPVGAAYRFSADEDCTIIIQTIDGPVTVHRWAEICQTEA
ncbi:hydroxyquinol 1,2-dioxygenase [Rhodobacterales bacterium HKCCE2091]|nr:hydroxyquinol 1,2-dioxygenase [Rhodobacterales bacterium HKCCE2091]